MLPRKELSLSINGLSRRRGLELLGCVRGLSMRLLVGLGNLGGDLCVS